jgi:hypothetical protein
MQIKNRLILAHTIICILLLLGVLASSFVIVNVSAIATQRNRILTEVNLDDIAWRPFTEVPTPGMPTPSSEISNVSSQSLDGSSLRCAITSGYAYSNLHCYRNLDPDSSSNTFMMSLAFYYRPRSTFNNSGGSSIVQALEFTMSKWVQVLGNSGKRYEWAVQWKNVGTGAPKWRY